MNREKLVSCFPHLGNILGESEDEWAEWQAISVIF